MGVDRCGGSIGHRRWLRSAALDNAGLHHANVDSAGRLEIGVGEPLGVDQPNLSVLEAGLLGRIEHNTRPQHGFQSGFCQRQVIRINRFTAFTEGRENGWSDYITQSGRVPDHDSRVGNLLVRGLRSGNHGLRVRQGGADVLLGKGLVSGLKADLDGVHVLDSTIGIGEHRQNAAALTIGERDPACFALKTREDSLGSNQFAVSDQPLGQFDLSSRSRPDGGGDGGGGGIQIQDLCVGGGGGHEAADQASGGDERTNGTAIPNHQMISIGKPSRNPRDAI